MKNGWLPPGVPADVMEWPCTLGCPPGDPYCYRRERGTQGYEFLYAAAGHCIEVIAYVDGEKTHHWRGAVTQGTSSRTYVWQDVLVSTEPPA